MWSYSFEYPVLMIMGIILLFYYSRPRLPIRRNRVFFVMIVVQTLTIIADVVASYADNNFTLFHPIVLSILNMLYFVAFFARSYIMYLFAVTVMKDLPEKSPILTEFIRLPLYFGVLMSFVSVILGSAGIHNFIFYIDEEGYHSGGMYFLLYVCGFFYILMSFIASYMYRNRFGRLREKYSMALYNVILFVALLVRLTMPRFLVMDAFILMALLVVYLAFVNPEFMLDLNGTTFNSAAFKEHLEENMGDFKLIPLGIAVHNYREMREIYGYAAMEEGLKIIGRYLKIVFPKGKVFYVRNGRFIVLDSPETDFADKTRAIAERFRRAWKTPFMELYLSVGFANFVVTNNEHSADILIATIMNALDAAGKLDDEEPLVLDEENIILAEKERVIRNNIEYAIDHDGFALYLQPIAEARTGRIIGAEALSRIKDADGKIIYPNEFIPVAENSGRINELGEIVFDRTCRFIKEQGLEKFGIDWINVNLSPSQFVRTDLAERYASIVDKYGIDPGTVHLEITEGSMIDDNFLQHQMKAMGSKGFKFVLDDYGTGYSNLARLKRCPFINVKLDMSIVWDFCKEPDAILPNMVESFKHMGFTVTAEGVEDEAMVDIMKEIGCDLLQGYHYSKPIPAEEFAEKYRV